MDGDHYDLLDIECTATHEEVLAACLRLGEASRPDLHPGNPKAADTFAAIERAFEVLGDPAKRAAYDLERAAAKKLEEAPRPGVKTMDAGNTLLLSGQIQEEVSAALARYIARGSRIVSPLGKVGRQWVAACTVPATEHPADQTTTLNLADVLAHVPPPPAAGQVSVAGSDDCSIEQVGFKVYLTGATRLAVKAKVDELVELGAQLVGEISAEGNDQWVAMCDTGGYQNTGFRWRSKA